MREQRQGGRVTGGGFKRGSYKTLAAVESSEEGGDWLLLLLLLLLLPMLPLLPLLLLLLLLLLLPLLLLLLLLHSFSASEM